MFYLWVLFCVVLLPLAHLPLLPARLSLLCLRACTAAPTVAPGSHQVIEMQTLTSGRIFLTLVWPFQVIDERDKSDKLWELLTKLHENPPKADHGKTVSKS